MVTFPEPLISLGQIFLALRPTARHQMQVILLTGLIQFRLLATPCSSVVFVLRTTVLAAARRLAAPLVLPAGTNKTRTDSLHWKCLPKNLAPSLLATSQQNNLATGCGTKLLMWILCSDDLQGNQS